MLTNNHWEIVDQKLLAKMLQEFMYENIISPTVVYQSGDIHTYEWTDKQGTVYRFEAKKRLFDSYMVVADRIEVVSASEIDIPKSLLLLISIQQEGQMTSSTAGHLVKEYLHTLVADTHLREKSKRAEELASLDYAELEGEMTGHPWITYNKGRIGFSYEDYVSYAPEQQKKVKLSWIAVHRQISSFHSIEGLSYDNVITGELNEKTRAQFVNELERAGVEPSNYYFLPIHLWQWDHVIVSLFAAEIAGKEIIPLGEGDDQYLPQQSIRTFVNVSNKKKYHVKLPMSILNTLVYRGLPSERTVIAPEVTAFMKGIHEQDNFLKDECRLGLLGEVATMNVDHRTFTKLKGAPYQYLEMLGVIWRESIYQELEDGEQPITLAALLHEDSEGTSLVQTYIEKSELTVEQWVKKLSSAILNPLLHYLYQYGTVFSPHGQNTVLVLKDYQPERIIMKDFVDDVNISDQPIQELQALSPELKKVLRSEPPEGLTQFILTGLFICHFRYLSNILEDKLGFSEYDFWKIVRETILTYQQRFPQLAERFELFDLLRPEFTKLTLNRNRMFDYGYEDDGDRPHASEHGTVTNALHQVTTTIKQ
ncbi:IucA/IucC family siderophore biosynthesis protein [Halalkalibacterium halodurans]|uniref:IucA/IucC family protein n=1 Tax=Halalkalibacterium halodurans TaxID=86665 RepID=UPI002E1A9520|nr:IucA/IucC family siderophore biosynthesis protein [Halalkalibacterium halodurans]MED4086298.1 IucA/IucC family siderophore biosynthesis protein [Halalkalibacterium halodurans]MED4103357.1 IucA/IucC family siderophore biosynthesis protein [Halalkalibacterium halodurans]MED4107946.1 IucA/IucC family siderophore biosynthesis protein [Halalkalibacterium halodurans]MED4148249.1 IucA/IucC family siderophore biosynthesis protein [Halalkalibacterium halodurans]